jgi:hypothetical protein
MTLLTIKKIVTMKGSTLSVFVLGFGYLTDGFVPIVLRSQAMTWLSAKTKRRVEAQPDIFKNDSDEDIGQRIPIRNIERDWTFEGFEGTRSIPVDLFIPENEKPKGCVFFMHGFSQYPIAYRKTLKKLKKLTEEVGVAVVAVETGLTDKVAFDLSDSHFALQRAVSQDTVQCRLANNHSESTFRKMYHWAFADTRGTESLFRSGTTYSGD